MWWENIVARENVLCCSAASAPGKQLSLLGEIYTKIVSEVVILFLCLFLLTIFLLCGVPCLKTAYIVFAVGPRSCIFLSRSRLACSFLFILVCYVIGILCFFVDRTLSSNDAVKCGLIFCAGGVQLMDVEGREGVSAGLLLKQRLVFLYVILSA